MPEQLGVDLRVYLRAVRQNWKWILVFAALGAALAAVVTLRTPTTYASSVGFFVTTPNSGSESALSGDQFGQQRVNSYVKLVPSERLASMVAKDSNTGLSADEVSKRLSAEADINTVLLNVQAQDTSPSRARSLAKATSTDLVKLVENLESENGRRTSPVRLAVVSGPTDPEPVAPEPRKNIAIGLLAGLALGVAAALLRQLMDNTVRDTESLRVTTRLPVLGTVNYDRHADTSPLLVRGQTGSGGAESFRQLRTGLQFASVDEPVKVLVVTSSIPSEGKSLVAANLALAFANTGSRVLLLEADLRRPKVCDYLGVDRTVGLSNVLAGQVELDDAVQPYGSGQLMVLPSGSIPPNPSELLGTRNMVDLLDSLREMCDLVIIDTPPLLPVTDAAVVAARSDGTVLVTRHGFAKRAQLGQAVRSLQAVGAQVLGTVLTMVPESKGGETDYEGYESVPVTRPEPADVPSQMVSRQKRKSATAQAHQREPGASVSSQAGSGEPS